MVDRKISELPAVTTLAAADPMYAVATSVSSQIRTDDFGQLMTGTIDVVRDHGATGDGSTDDTAEIQAAIDAAEVSGGVVFFPSGTYIVSSALTVLADKVHLLGAGAYLVEIKGNFLAGDIIQIGDGATEIKLGSMKNIRVASSVTKTSGAGVHVNKVARYVFHDVTLDGQDGDGNLWDGIWFDGVDRNTYTGVDIQVQNRGLIVNALDAVSGHRAGLTVNEGKISGCAKAIVVGGGYGGLVMGPRLDVINNTNNMDIDESIISDNNEALFFHGVLFDTTLEHNITINDGTAGSGIILFADCWIASAGKATGAGAGTWHGLLITDLQGHNLEISGGRIFNNDADGINIVDASLSLKQISMGGGLRVENNGEWGIQAASSTIGVKIGDEVVFFNNTNGNIHTTVEPQARNVSRKYIIEDDAAVSIVLPTPTTVAKITQNNRIDGYGEVIVKSTTPDIAGLVLASNTEVTTGVLAGTTGNDAKMTISVHTDNKLYVENRLGGSLDFYVEFFGAP